MRHVLLVILLLVSAPVHAYDVGGGLPNAADEARARDLFRELRCMVCQNQSIDDSEAPLAKDLRTLVRERVAAGESNEAIKAFLVDRYGDFVLLRPRFGGETLLLWVTPIVVLLGGAVAVLVLARRRNQAPSPAPLTGDERRRLDVLTGDRS